MQNAEVRDHPHALQISLGAATTRQRVALRLLNPES
jgi:hypothetical protein